MSEHRVRVRVKSGAKTKYGKIKAALGAELVVIDVQGGIEFVIDAKSAKRLEEVQAKLAGSGLEQIPGSTEATKPAPRSSNAGQHGRLPPQAAPLRAAPPQASRANIRRKPYGFVPLPDHFATADPVWHDGTCSKGRLSGEVRFELTNLTPLLVGWERDTVLDREALAERAREAHPDSSEDSEERRRIQNRREDFVKAELANTVNLAAGSPFRAAFPDAGEAIGSKALLCPMRAPWGRGPVIIPGDSLKGLLRHEIGALLGAPMERVQERNYSYRPNSKYPNASNRRLEPRLARVVANQTVPLHGKGFPVPTTVNALVMAKQNQQSYYPRRQNGHIIQAPAHAEPYRGGMGGGVGLPRDLLAADAQPRMIHTALDVGSLGVERSRVPICGAVRDQYLHTLEHLFSTENGHFSARHPRAGNNRKKQQSGVAALKAAASRAFQPGHLIWVEWDTQANRIVSFGWHYYYRWAYQDTVRTKRWTDPRTGLVPLSDETAHDEQGAPSKLTAVRRLFGYTGDNPGSEGIGQGHYTQLMGRVSINAALEVVPAGATDEERFLPPTFLKELGLPRPSAVEYYLQQPYYPNSRPSDNASLVTYGDTPFASGYDSPGVLTAANSTSTGRTPTEESRPGRTIRPPTASTTAAPSRSKPQARRPFRFTLRFRDLDRAEPRRHPARPLPEPVPRVRRRKLEGRLLLQARLRPAARLGLGPHRGQGAALSLGARRRARAREGTGYRQVVRGVEAGPASPARRVARHPPLQAPRR